MRGDAERNALSDGVVVGACGQCVASVRGAAAGRTEHLRDDQGRLMPTHWAWLWLGVRGFKVGRMNHARVRGYALGLIYVETW